MAPVPAAEVDLAARAPVWEALSDLFLDTDITLSRQWRASQLAASSYSLEQLEFILLHEVLPVCKYNLLSVAGVWDGFDQEWLKTKILGRLRSPFRSFHALSRQRLDAHTSVEWEATKQKVVSSRRAGIPSEA